MTDFESPTLKRRFAAVHFGELTNGPNAAPPAPASATTPAVKPVPRAEGERGRTVAELFAQRVQLSDRPVAVRGRVVKFNAGILGKNWVHLQDGSGSPKAEDHDGYKFPVLIEQAKLER
jgi:hypothetical protein